MEYLFLLLIPVFMHILYTDIKWRKVHLAAIIAAILLSTFRLIYSVPVSVATTTLLLNFILLAIFIAVILIYTRIRKIKLLNAIATGDLLFLGIAAINLSPVVFILFIILSSVTGSVYYLFLNINNAKQKTVPFAGLMAACLSPVIVLDVFAGISFITETNIIQLYN